MQYIDAGVLGAFKARQVTRKWRYCNTVAIEVYCDCRGIEEGDMIECNKCKEWYHKVLQGGSQVFHRVRGH